MAAYKKCLDDSAIKDKSVCDRLAGLATSDKCNDQVRAVSEAARKAHEACASSTGGADIEKCKSLSEECAEMNSREADGSQILASVLNQTAPALGVPGFSMETGKYKGQCMSEKKYSDKKKDIKGDLDKLKEKISKLQKDIVKTQEDAEKDKLKIQKALTELNEQARKDDLQMAADERKEAESAQAETVQMQLKLRSLQSEIIRSQGQVAQMIGERTRNLAKLSDAMIQKNCTEALEKVKAQQKALRTGSAGSVIKQNSEVRRRLKLDYDNCIKEMLTIRESGREQTQANIDAANQDITAKNEEIRGIQQALQLRQANLAQQKAERQQSKSQAMQERMQRMQQLNQEFQTVTTATQQKVAQMQQELMQAQMDMGKSSNELATLGSEPVGEKAPAEAVAAMNALKSTISTCASLCPVEMCGKQAADEFGIEVKGTK
jgi:hypothetical protein